MQRQLTQLRRLRAGSVAPTVGTDRKQPARSGSSLALVISGPVETGNADPVCRGAREAARQWQQRAYDAVLAQGRERERIAAGLHDDIGQALSVAALKLGELQQHAATAKAQVLIDELRQLLGHAMKATRSATFELSCPLLAQLGLPAALDSMVARAQAQGGPPVRLRVQALDKGGGDASARTALQEPALGVVFRVARELVFNIRKHAQAQRGELRLRCGTRGVALTVADDGGGFCVQDPFARFSPDGGYGLISAMAQVQAVGGRLVLRSRVGHGTVARLWVPADVGLGAAFEPGRP